MDGQAAIATDEDTEAMTWSDRRYDDGFQPRQHMSVAVKRIIIATVAVWLIQVIGGRQVWRWQLHYLGLHPGTFVSSLFVWQPFTYVFVHDSRNIFHILFNMLCLAWLGQSVEGALGARKFTVLYVCGGLAAGVSYCVFRAFAPSPSAVVGASGAVMAVTVAFAVLFPDVKLLFMFLFPIKAKHLAMLLVAIDLLSGIKGSSGDVAHAAHLGGALFGFLFFKLAPLVRSASSGHAAKKLKTRLDGVQRERARVDDILDKINRDGMGSLTKAERKFLMEASKHYRERTGMD